jgi:hypothetical protein
MSGTGHLPCLNQPISAVFQGDAADAIQPHEHLGLKSTREENLHGLKWLAAWTGAERRRLVTVPRARLKATLFLSFALGGVLPQQVAYGW